MTTELVGPVRTVRFGWRPGSPEVNYTPPGNTCDPRYDACTDHHVACDCREAEWSEQTHESAGEAKHTQAVFDRVLAGHPTRIYGSPNKYTGETDLPCQCTGCQIARECSIYPRSSK